MQFDYKAFGAAIAFVAALLTVQRLYGLWSAPERMAGAAVAAEAAISTDNKAPKPLQDLRSAQTITLSESQAQAIKIEAACIQPFRLETVATGSLDFNQDMSVQVFAPYQGKILSLFAKIGDEVEKGQVLYTIDSPDLLQAESTLIQTAAVLDLTTRSLTRAKRLVEIGGGAQKDLEQAVSDQLTAEGNFKAARNALHIFGKSDGDIDRIVADRRVDSTLPVPSPITGMITARAAAPGLLVQPGNAPAPYTVSDISTKWMNMNVSEIDIPSLRLNQEIEAKILAFPERSFRGKITTIAASVDPATRRLLVRSEIADPEHLMRPGMFASSVIHTGRPIHAVAVSQDAVVREGDGTMSVWITRDRHQFTQRTVRIGLRQGGFDEIVDGLIEGDLVVSDGALLLSNMLAGAATD